MKPCVCALLLCSAALGQTAADATLSGKITDAVTHEAIRGVLVRYCCSSRAATTSDGNGDWSLHISPGADATSSFLSVSKDGYAPLVPDSDSERLTVTLKPGASETRNFELSPAAHIFGRLLDRDSDKPLAGLRVVARLPDGLGFSAEPSRADGSFEVGLALKPGDYRLEIVPALTAKIVEGKSKAKESDYGPSWFPGSPRQGPAEPVTVSAGESREVVLRLQKRELHHIAGVIEVPPGREDEPLILIVASGPPATRQIARGEIFRAGPFHVDGLDQGPYTLFAAFDSNRRRPPLQRGFATETVELTERNIDDSNVAMRPAVSIRAVVTMAEERDGKNDPPDGIRFLPEPVIALHSDDAGSATLSPGLLSSGLPAGRYWPRLVVPRGYAVSSVTFNARPVLHTAIDILLPESTVDFVVTSHPAGLAGTVRDSDQKPIRDAFVALLPESLPATFEEFDEQTLRVVRSGPNGTFQFSDLAPGRYKVAAVIESEFREQPLGGTALLRERAISGEAISLDPDRTANLDLHIK